MSLEIQTGRVAAPSLSLPSLSSMWAISMSYSNTTNLGNVILGLSSPTGHSVTDGIAGKDYSLQYMTVDEIFVAIMRLGRGFLMAKFDVLNAYHIVPVHTEDCRLLGMKWCGAFYVDIILPSASGQLHISSHV